MDRSLKKARKAQFSDKFLRSDFHRDSVRNPTFSERWTVPENTAGKYFHLTQYCLIVSLFVSRTNEQQTKPPIKSKTQTGSSRGGELLLLSVLLILLLLLLSIHVPAICLYVCRRHSSHRLHQQPKTPAAAAATTSSRRSVAFSLWDQFAFSFVTPRRMKPQR